MSDFVGFVTFLRALAYFFSALYMARLLEVHRLRYLLLIAGNERKHSRSEVEDIILYAGFILMFSGLFVATIISIVSPSLFDTSRGIISPGAMVVLAILLKRAPRYTREFIRKHFKK